MDSNDRILDTIHQIANLEQQEFEELIDMNSEKETFVRNLSKPFSIILNTNYNTAEKTKRVIKVAIETKLKLWSEPNRQ